jgi:undecaprenyl-diphosphatase
MRMNPHAGANFSTPVHCIQWRKPVVTMRSVVHRVPQAGQDERIHVLIIAALLIPAALLSFIATGPGVLPDDITTTLFVQTHIPAQAAWFFETVNWIGTSLVAALITTLIGLVLVALRRPVAAAMVLLTFALRVTNGMLKSIFDSPRPTEAVVGITEFPGGYGFPSGHVMGATLLYGMLFILAPQLTERRPLRLAIQIAAIVMMVLAGISRIYVGAHWPSDVLGGYLWGVIVLLGGVFAVRICLRLSRIRF